jgi:hypothetical protein
MITLAAACSAALLAALPASALAGSLLGGYGGPGQGSQVILGSSLVNGGGAGGGPHNGGGSTRAAEPATAATGAQSPAAGTGTGTGTNVSKTSTRARTRKLGSLAAGGLHGYRGSSNNAALGTAPGGSDTLGLSPQNLLYVLLGLVALVFTGLLTRKIARPAAVSRHGS